MVYRLLLHRVICDEEPPRPGSDEFWFSAVATAMDRLVDGGESPAGPDVRRWRHDDFDSDEERTPDLVRYEGDGPENLQLPYLAVEVDRERKAEKLLARRCVDRHC